MTAIVDFIKGISDAVVSVFNFVLDFFADIAYVVKLTAEFVSKIPDYIAWLPAPVVAMIISIFAVVVIYKVLGREG